MPFLTAALYQFVELPDHAALQAPLLAVCEAHGIKGTLLLVGDSSTLSTHAFFKDLLAHIKRIGGYRTAPENDTA